MLSKRCTGLNILTELSICESNRHLCCSAGYGDIVVESDFGKIFLWFYAMLGIPLHLYTSYLIGKVITDALKNLLRLVEFRLLQRISIKYEAAKTLFLSLLLSIVWTLICSLIVVKRTHWTVIDALYFSFVSMLTIGFGDLTIDLVNETYLHLHLYIGTSLVAAVINGTVELFKRPENSGAYNVSRNKRRISLVDIHQYRHSMQLNGLQLDGLYTQNGTDKLGITQQTELSSVIRNNSMNTAC